LKLFISFVLTYCDKEIFEKKFFDVAFIIVLPVVVFDVFDDGGLNFPSFLTVFY